MLNQSFAREALISSPASEALLFGSTFTFLPLPDISGFFFRSSPLSTHAGAEREKVFILVLITCERRLLNPSTFSLPPPSLVSYRFLKGRGIDANLNSPLFEWCAPSGIDRYPGGRYHSVDGLGLFCFCFFSVRDPGYFGEWIHLRIKNDRRLTMWVMFSGGGETTSVSSFGLNHSFRRRGTS